jgi:pimeloyl-ACP methyl ester carboxylesterase
MPTTMAIANEIQQCYEVSGNRGSWVTLVHGSGDNHEAWWLQVPTLAKRFRVLTYDVRGHGETETPADKPIDQATFVEDLRGLLDKLKIGKTAVIGYSMGGGIARNFAATHPDRVWGVVLSNGGRLDPPPDPSREAEMAKMREGRIAGIREGGMESVFDGWLTNVYTPEFAEARPEIVAQHRRIMTANDPEKYSRTMSGAMSSSKVDLNRLTSPTLIIVGAGDEYTGPDAGRELAAALPRQANAQVNVFPTRHGSPFERHEEYNQTLIDFLEANRPRRA